MPIDVIIMLGGLIAFAVVAMIKAKRDDAKNERERGWLRYSEGLRLQRRFSPVIGVGEELFELSDDLLLVLQRAAHRDWIGSKEQAGHTADRAFKRKTRPRADPIPNGTKPCRVCLGRDYINGND